MILSVSYFKSQSKGEDGVSQSIVAKALPVITHHLAKLFSASLSKEIFPMSWEKAQVLALKKTPVPSSPSFCETNLGLRQGSVLGPLLVCLNMNDLRLHLNIVSLMRLLYADDLQIYIQVPLDLIHRGVHHLPKASCRVAESGPTPIT